MPISLFAIQWLPAFYTLPSLAITECPTPPVSTIFLQAQGFIQKFSFGVEVGVVFCTCHISYTLGGSYQGVDIKLFGLFPPSLFFFSLLSFFLSPSLFGGGGEAPSTGWNPAICLWPQPLSVALASAHQICTQVSSRLARLATGLRLRATLANHF